MGAEKKRKRVSADAGDGQEALDKAERKRLRRAKKEAAMAVEAAAAAEVASPGGDDDNTAVDTTKEPNGSAALVEPLVSPIASRTSQRNSHSFPDVPYATANTRMGCCDRSTY